MAHFAGLNLRPHLFAQFSRASSMCWWSRRLSHIVTMSSAYSSMWMGFDHLFCLGLFLGGVVMTGFQCVCSNISLM